MNNKTKSNTLFLLLILINMTVMISDYKVICNKVGAVSTLLIMFIILIYSRGKIGYHKSENQLLLFILIFIGYYAISSLYKGAITNIIGAIIYYLIEFSSIFIYLYLLKRDNLAYQKKLLTVFFIVWDIFCVIAVYYYIKLPDLARLMAAYRSSYTSLIIGGGYAMAYGSAILGVFILQSLLEHKELNKSFRVFGIIEIVLLSILVYFTNSFVILVSMLLGYVLCIFRHTLKGSLFIVSMVLLLLLVLVFYLNIGSVLQWLLKINNNEFLERRISEIYELVTKDVASYHLQKRSGLYEMSLHTFFRYPLFGVGYHFGNVSALQNSYGVGAHSTILDSLAQYGLLGSISIFGIIGYPFIHNKEKNYSSVYLVTFIIMLLLNPCFTTYHCFLVVYLIIPIMQCMIEVKTNDKQLSDFQGVQNE